MQRIALEPATRKRPAERDLWRQFPALEGALPCLNLASLPTPVTALPALAGDRCRALFVKRDDQIASTYGGNKVRKLEFLLGHAVDRGCREVLTFGVAGSNHALATAVCAARAGLSSISMLTPQTNTRYVAKNLLMSLVAGAELHYYRTQAEADAGARFQLLRHKRRTGVEPLLIPGGGSNALGTVGFVNAGLELASQVDAGLLPAPDRIYLPLGTMGTVAGLRLGLAAAGLKTRIMAVRVVHPNIGNEARLEALTQATIELLRTHGCKLAPSQLADVPVELCHDFFGRKYAVFTDEGMAAIRRAAEHGLQLDGTYTGKAFAALLADLDSGALDGQSVVFWNTLSSANLSPLIADVDYRQLPTALHWYFQHPVQRLDR